MTVQRFNLNVLRRDGKALRQPEIHKGVYCETHNQINFAWRDEGVPAAKPLHNGVVTIHANGIRLVGFEREADAYSYQEWWLAPLDSDDLPDIPLTGGEPLNLGKETATPQPAPPPAKTVADDDDEVFADIQWDETMCLGDEALDEDHRALFRQADMLIDAVERPEQAAGVVSETLDFLQAYMDRHFPMEEALMEKSGFPGLADHRRRHDRLRARVADYAAGFAADPDGFDTRDFLRFMRHWLVQHVEREDQAVRPYLESPLSDLDNEDPAADGPSVETDTTVPSGDAPNGARDALSDALRAVRQQIGDDSEPTDGGH